MSWLNQRYLLEFSASIFYMMGILDFSLLWKITEETLSFCLKLNYWGQQDFIRVQQTLSKVRRCYKAISLLNYTLNEVWKWWHLISSVKAASGNASLL